MKDIEQIKRLPSPAQRPQSLAWDGERLWMGSLATGRIYQLDIDSWEVLWETKAPGLPFGMTIMLDELRVICSETDKDHRIIRRCLSGIGFDEKFELPCPDDTGSQLGCDGHNLYVSQWYKQQIHAIDERGQVQRTLHSPRGICGQVIVGDTLFLANTDDENTDDYYLTCLSLKNPEAKPLDLARIPFAARALAWDGSHFWTNHRERHEIICFASPT